MISYRNIFIIRRRARCHRNAHMLIILMNTRVKKPCIQPTILSLKRVETILFHQGGSNHPITFSRVIGFSSLLFVDKKITSDHT